MVKLFRGAPCSPACWHPRAVINGDLVIRAGYSPEALLKRKSRWPIWPRSGVGDDTLPCAPDQLFRFSGRVYATCPDGWAMVEIDEEKFRVAGRIALPGKPVAARLLQDTGAALVLTTAPDAVVAVDLVNRRVAARLALPGAPAGLDRNGLVAAITIPARSSVLRISIPDLKLAGSTDVGVPCGPINFRRDGRTIWREQSPSAKLWRWTPSLEDSSLDCRSLCCRRASVSIRMADRCSLPEAVRTCWRL